MAQPATEIGAGTVPARTVRMSGTSLAPRWRGRLHLGAAVLAAPAAAALTWHQPDFSIALYAAGLLALYVVSASYHLVPTSAERRQMLRRADHSMIYVFTAACYTPFCVHLIDGVMGTTVLALVWAAALIGVVIKLSGRPRWARFASVLYLLQGWLAVATLPQAVARLSAGQFALVIVMGALYTSGAVVLFTRRPDPLPAVFGYHEVWHALVVLASACYFAVVWNLAGAAAP